MSSFFYLRLAVSNIKKNKSIYKPYLLAASLIVSLFYSLLSISYMVGTSNAEGGYTIALILQLSAFVCGIMSFVILFYINSFIMKRRKTEFGLYSILGMEKRHISRVMSCEVLVTGVVSIAGGITCGALFSQLLFMILMKIVGLPIAFSFQIPFSAFLTTVILFGVGFFIVLIYDIICVLRSKPIELLHAENVGEKEPKSHLLFAVVGVVALAFGYAFALSVKKPSDVVVVFLACVLLVIIGTYCLFMAGSIVLLKLLRKNKSFYYKPKNFISISGMIYRMKQNATGLASICILSTCVLVTLSSTVSLFIGEEGTLRSVYPQQIKTSCIVKSENSSQALEKAAQTHAEKYSFAIENAFGYTDLTLPVTMSKNEFFASDFYNNSTSEMTVLLLSEYNSITGSTYTLKDNEILVSKDGSDITGENVILFNQPYFVKGSFPIPEFFSSVNIGLENSILIVVPSLTEMLQLQSSSASQGGRRVALYNYRYDAIGDENARSEYYATMRNSLAETVENLSAVDNIDYARSNFYLLYGSLMFVGVFFVVLFLTTTALIIYYKQITEGFDDHARFKIMQNVGMSDKEVHSTISNQVLMVFFLPLGMALLHIAFAFPVMTKLLIMFNMHNTGLFLICTLCTGIAFILFYSFIYNRTAQAYFRIVQKR